MANITKYFQPSRDSMVLAIVGAALLVVTGVVAALGILFAPALTHVLAPDFPPAKLALTDSGDGSGEGIDITAKLLSSALSSQQNY